TPGRAARAPSDRARPGPSRSVIYVDTSVALAQLLAEDRFPDPSFWQEETLVSSRLLLDEVWTRGNRMGPGPSQVEELRSMLGHLVCRVLWGAVRVRAQK